MEIRLVLRTWWKSLLLLAIVSFIIAIPITITRPSNNLVQALEAFGLLVAAIVGIAGAWGLLDKKAERLLFLTQQVRNQVADEAKSAISQLNAEGFLHNGSLKHVDFSGVRLSGVDLKATDQTGAHVAANLERANLKQAELSGADMRGINLKGANLDMTNLENASLMEANLSDANFELTDLQGTKFLKAKLQGARFKGALFDKNTVLPDGSYWREGVDWALFGAIEELSEHIRNKIANLPKTSDPLLYENVGQREHDLKLLARLWKKVNSRNITRLDKDTQNRNLEYEFYSENFGSYLQERHEHSELKFISSILEKQFLSYDTTLGEFIEHLFQSARVEDFHGTRTVRPDYKQRA